MSQDYKLKSNHTLARYHLSSKLMGSTLMTLIIPPSTPHHPRGLPVTKSPAITTERQTP